MTNTLHRYGSPETFRDDFIVFAIPTKANREGSGPKLKTFLEIAAKHGPVNMGGGGKGGLYRPSERLTPLVPHESTGVAGRGTEEVKTNDVTGRVRAGEAGFTVEFGRPGIGVRFRDIDRVTRALGAAGVTFEAMNPVTSLMTDAKTGAIRDDILDEKVLSAIVEVKTGFDRAPDVLRTLRSVSDQVSTVISVGVSARCDARGNTGLDALLAGEGFRFWRGKTNLGLGRPLYREAV